MYTLCAEMKLLADWKLLMLQKGFSHSFWCTRDLKFFFLNSISVCFWRKGKCFTLLSQLVFSFSKQLSYLRPIFCELVHRKTFALPTDCCFWTKDLKMKAERGRKSLAARKSRISEDFLDLSTENRKFRRYSILSLFSKWNESTEFSKQLSFSGSKVHPLKRNIKDRQRICFLFVDWANWKFFFFVEEMFRVSIVFSCL